LLAALRQHGDSLDVKRRRPLPAGFAAPDEKKLADKLPPLRFNVPSTLTIRLPPWVKHASCARLNPSVKHRE